MCAIPSALALLVPRVRLADDVQVSVVSLAGLSSDNLQFPPSSSAHFACPSHHCPPRLSCFAHRRHRDAMAHDVPCSARSASSPSCAPSSPSPAASIRRRRPSSRPVQASPPWRRTVTASRPSSCPRARRPSVELRGAVRAAPASVIRNSSCVCGRLLC